MNARDLTALVHLVGFATGIVLYAMLGVMTRRRLAYVATPSDARAVDRVPLVAAMLGVIWNVGAMVVYAARDFDISHSLTWVAAIAYTALGFLPAVVVHSTVRRSSPTKHRWYVGIAYAGSGAAGVLQLVDALATRRRRRSACCSSRSPMPRCSSRSPSPSDAGRAFSERFPPSRWRRLRSRRCT